jgi:hypothetical protein
MYSYEGGDRIESPKCWALHKREIMDNIQKCGGDKVHGRERKYLIRQGVSSLVISRPAEIITKQKTNSMAFSPRANYTD